MNKIKVKTIIEIVGMPKEHVDETLKKVVEQVEKYKKVELLDKELFNAEETKPKPLFSAFCELEIGVNKISDLISFCFDFMPSSVEILEPLDISDDSQNFSGLINDLLARLHQYDMILKNMRAELMLAQKKTKDFS